MYLYAAPSYLSDKSQPATPAELSNHSCILAQPHGPEPKALWVLHNAEQRVGIKLHGTLILNSIGLITRLAVAGAGIALLPEDLCREDVRAGRLVRVLDGWCSPRVPIHALTASRLIPAKTRAFLEFLKIQMKNVGPTDAS
ncbi:substrate binding domain-containing protein [Polaromonas sp. P1(28)-8]|nr:substrate binding domain-containing protein [Polaromonas sp. P1(28)-8]